MLFKFFRHWRDSYVGIPRTIWFLALINLVNRLGSMVIVFITIYLTKELHFGIREAGYVMGFFGAGALTGAFVGGKLTDRFGYYPVQFWSLIANGVMLILLLPIRDFWLMCAAVYLMSLTGDVFRPANSVAIARNSAPENRTRSISLMRMAFNMGWTIAPAVGGLLVATLGWTWLFWIDGITCIAAALTLRWLMPPKPEEKIVETPENKVAIPVVVSPYRDRPFLWFALLTMLNAVVFMQFLWTVPVFWKDGFQWTEAQIGLMSALNGLMVFLIEMPLVHRLEGRRPQLSYARMGLLMYIVAYLSFELPLGASAVALMFIIFISFGEMFVMPFSSNYVYGRSAGNQQGQYMALYTMAYSIANIAAPLFGTQVIAAWGYSTLWYLLAVLALITWAGFWMLDKKTSKPKMIETESLPALEPSPQTAL
ncbi:MAG: MFS transporter [Saprospiraceae bacterium]